MLFWANCARCRGEDGSDTTGYPNVKSLVDITRRMPTNEILRQSEGFIGVRLEGRDAAALVVHLETLRSGGYARPEMLVETDWVALQAGDAGVRLVDVRAAAAYAAGHIPGAVHLDARSLRTADDRDTYLPRPEAFAAMMSRVGIANDTHVVVYDDQGGREAARLWYVLNAYGHERVSLVNGGWNKWVAEERPRETTAAAPAPTRFTPRLTLALSCPSPELLARRPGVVVLDTRAAAEFRGEQTSRGATRAGHILGAVHVEWRENVTGPHLTFKPAEALKQLYEAAGITPDKEIVTYCASGGRAAQTLFTLKLLGYPKVRVYYGSFSDYSARPDAPVEK